MGQNTSSAVMAQRREPPDSLDYFPTPPWATRALCEHLLAHDEPLADMVCAEPACGEGHMARPLDEYFDQVRPGDIFDYSATWPGQHIVADFTGSDTELYTATGGLDWVITNPPFKVAEQFIDIACRMACRGVGMLVRSAFLEGVGRHDRLFSKNPPSRILQFCERVPMHKGRLTATGSTATSYCWLVWIDGDFVGDEPQTTFHWIPPCRARLERPGDYINPGEAADRGPLFGGGL